MRRRQTLIRLLPPSLIVLAAGCSNPGGSREEGFVPLFDGKTLEGWVKSAFDQKGEVSVKEGTLVIHAGQSMSGVTWEGDFPTSNYEVTFEAQRVDGSASRSPECSRRCLAGLGFNSNLRR